MSVQDTVPWEGPRLMPELLQPLTHFRATETTAGFKMALPALQGRAGLFQCHS